MMSLPEDSHEPDEQTLFHLIPRNSAAARSLRHPSNARFVSNSARGTPGLEVGYHVTRRRSDRVLARVGRKGDLVLCSGGKGGVSRVAASFELNPQTHYVVIKDWSDNSLSRPPPPLRTWPVSPEDREDVKTGEEGEEADDGGRLPDEMRGDCAFLFGREYMIVIGGSQKFRLSWHGWGPAGGL